MQGTLPVGDAPDHKPGWPRRRYVVVGLGLVLLAAASAMAGLAWLRPAGPAPLKPLPDIAELASNYRLSETLSDAFGPQSWSPDGRYLVTYSASTYGLQVHDRGGPNPRTWSVPAEASYSYRSIGIAEKAMWSPDSRLLAVDAVRSSVPYTNTVVEPNSALPYTITVVDAEKGTVRNTIRVLGPPELAATPTPAGRNRTAVVETFHQLVGWADNGRSLVTLLFVERREDVDGNPAYSLFDPTPQPDATPVPPSFSVYFYVHDAATGDMVSSMQVYFTTAYPSVYGLALSPDGNTLAFATTDRTPQPAESTSQVNLSLWDLRAGRLKHKVEGLGDEVVGPFPGIWDQFLAWSPDGATLYVASDITVKVVEVATGKVVRRFPEVVPPTSTPLPTAPQPPTPGPGTSFPQPTPGGPPTATPDPDRYYPIQNIELSPAGDRLAVADYRTIRVWDTASGNLRMLTSMPGIVPSHLNASMYDHSHARLTWLAEGRLLASHFSDYGSGIWLIDPETGVHLRRLVDYLQYVAWSPATNMFATDVWQHSVEIWAVDSQGPTPSATASAVP